MVRGATSKNNKRFTGPELGMIVMGSRSLECPQNTARLMVLMPLNFGTKQLKDSNKVRSGSL